MFNIFDIFKVLMPSRSTVSRETEEKIKREWQNINVLLKQRGPSQLRQALISSDKCLDNALRDIVAGDSMGDRLKNSQTRFDRDLYNKIWEAHKLRNNVVHEAGFEAPYFVITESVETFKKALFVLGVTI